MNAVHLTGIIGQYGIKIADTENAKPQTSFTRILEEGAYKTVIPVLIVGKRAEALAELSMPASGSQYPARRKMQASSWWSRLMSNAGR